MNTRSSPTQDRLPLEREVRAREKDERLSAPQPLSDYRDVLAWVLLADPGAGKSDVFSSLSLSEGGTCVSAREFMGGNLPVDWREPLFIDGLDEVTAGSTQGATLFDQIRKELRQLKVPKFRLSCREADWRGKVDAEALKQLVGDGNFAELHLAPLSHAQSVALIAYWQSNTDEAQAEAFMQEAEKRDLGGLLDNPQTLRMLVTAHAANGGDWPASKTQTYEMACAQLVREHNGEHLANSRDNTPPDDQTLLAAGYLCAVMLLSGSGAIALQRQSQSGVGVVTLNELKSADSAPDLPTCRAALHTRLFRGTGSRGEFAPVHRTVAEYLGARYLASRIQAGLPASRVQALMLGEDAGIVPELRGLHAWLAATAPEELRRELIERDPLGVVLNGDVRAFHYTDKLAVLNALQHEATQDPSFRRGNWISHPFGALATADMEEDFKALLQSPERGPAHQSVLDCVLAALVHGQPMPALAPELEQVVRDKTYRPDLRTEALFALDIYTQEDDSKSTLTQLLADVRSNAVEDSEDELLGALLQTLYPTHISSAGLWQYFRNPKFDHLSRTYWLFWNDLPNRAIEQEEVTALLDSLVSTGYQLSNDHDYLGTAVIVGELLISGVLRHGLLVEIPRLYDWLSLGLWKQDQSPFEQFQQAQLAQWLGDHSDIYKKLFEHGLKLSQTNEVADYSTFLKIHATLYHAPEPEDMVNWYLELAQTTTQTVLRRTLVNESFQRVWKHNGIDAAQQLLQTWLCKHPNDATCFDIYLHDFPPSKTTQKTNDLNLQQKTHDEEVAQQRLLFFRQALPSFEDGPAHLGALIEVAESYLSNLKTITRTTPEARLLKLLNQDPEWVRLALHGLRQCLFRGELPSAEDILALEAKSQRFDMVTPCLAAMALREAENSATALDLSNAKLEMVAAFQLTGTFRLDFLLSEQPSWFKRLLAQQPAIVASLMHKRIRAQIALKKERINGVSELAYNADYAEVAKKITLPLITTFPAKANKALLPALRTLILASMRHLASDTLSQLITDKLKNKTLDVAQHVYWLTAGLLLAPDLYLEPTQKYIGHNQARSHHVFNFIYQRFGSSEFNINLSPAAQTFLIGLLGPRSNPHVITQGNEFGNYVEGLISALTNNPDEAATQALTDLRQRHDLKHWHDSLNRALYDQRITRRKARFKHAVVADVCATLANLQPASAADLWALTVDHLTQVIRQIRDSDKDIYDQYWDGNTPKSEERCRNALLSALEPRLSPLGISAIPERQLADKKRADIGIASGLIHIPLEAKGEWNRDLWKAIDKQLIAQYCREPASDGYGIYLVFWFAYDLKAAPTDGGTKPKTPEELQQRLTATVPEALKHKIAVLVVDCSKPKTA